ncbi:RIP metalloprotease RseP [Enterococcus sp. LJL98]
MKTILTFLIVFSVVVVIHELGHFYFAKKAGILVREFAIGMGPKLFSHQGKDGTAYTIRGLPMGGYVRMAGYEEEEEMKPGTPITLLFDEKGIVTKINTSKKVQLTNGVPFEVVRHDLVDDLTISGFMNGDESQTITYSVNPDAFIIEEDGTEVRIAPREKQFQSAKLWQRALTNFAGPMNNFILAFVLFLVIVFARGGVVDPQSTVISGVEPNAPAAVAGMVAGDQILTINDQKVTSWTSVRTLIQEYAEEDLTLVVQRDGQEKIFKMKPKFTEVEGQKYAQLGIFAPMKTGFFDKVAGAFKESIASFTQILAALRNIIFHFDVNQLGGPVAIYELSSQAAKQGIMTVIALMAMISMNLGIFNLLPIPGLDGGKLLLNLIEGIRGEPLSQEKEGLISIIGFGFLMLLMVFVTWNDIQRFFF